MQEIALTCVASRDQLQQLRRGCNMSTVHVIGSRTMTPITLLGGARLNLGTRLLPPRPLRRKRMVITSSMADTLKRLGLPMRPLSIVPDFASEKRTALLTELFSKVDPGTYSKLLADDFVWLDTEASYSKEEWMQLMKDCVLAALPDFNWTAATDGIVDEQGCAIVIVQMTGHHTGAPFQLPKSDLPPLPPSGRRVSLAEGAIQVLCQDGRVKVMKVIPGTSSSMLSLYRALAGQEGGVPEAPGAGKATYTHE